MSKAFYIIVISASLLSCKKRNELTNPFLDSNNCQSTFLSENVDTIYPSSILPLYPGSEFNYKFRTKGYNVNDSADVYIPIDPEWHLVGFPLTSTTDSCGALFDKKSYVPKAPHFFSNIHFHNNHRYLFGEFTTNGLNKPKNLFELGPFQALQGATLTIDTLSGLTTVEGIDYQNVIRLRHSTPFRFPIGKFNYVSYTRTEIIYFVEDIGIIYYYRKGYQADPTTYKNWQSYSLTSYNIND